MVFVRAIMNMVHIRAIWAWCVSGQYGHIVCQNNMDMCIRVIYTCCFREMSTCWCQSNRIMLCVSAIWICCMSVQYGHVVHQGNIHMLLIRAIWVCSVSEQYIYVLFLSGHYDHVVYEGNMNMYVSTIAICC